MPVTIVVALDAAGSDRSTRCTAGLELLSSQTNKWVGCVSFGQSTIWSVEKCTADDTSDTWRPSATLMALVLSSAVYGPSALRLSGVPTPNSCSDRSFNWRCTHRPQSISPSADTRGPIPIAATTATAHVIHRAFFIVGLSPLHLSGSAVELRDGESLEVRCCSEVTAGAICCNGNGGWPDSLGTGGRPEHDRQLPVMPPPEHQEARSIFVRGRNSTTEKRSHGDARRGPDG